MKVTSKYELTEDARQNWLYFDVYARRIILDGLRVQLVESDPEEETWHKGRLKTPVAAATHKVDIEKWRAFYLVERTASSVMSIVVLIGEKRGNKLFVKGKEFQT